MSDETKEKEPRPKKQVPKTREELLMRWREYEESGNFLDTPPVEDPGILRSGDVIRLLDPLNGGSGGIDLLITSVEKRPDPDKEGAEKWMIGCIKSATHHSFDGFQNSPGKMEEYALQTGRPIESLADAVELERAMREEPVAEEPEDMAVHEFTAQELGILPPDSGKPNIYSYPVLVQASNTGS